MFVEFLIRHLKMTHAVVLPNSYFVIFKVQGGTSFQYKLFLKLLLKDLAFIAAIPQWSSEAETEKIFYVFCAPCRVCKESLFGSERHHKAK